MPTRKLQVEIIGDASSLQRAFRDAGRSTSRLGGGLRTLGKVAGVTVGAAFAGMAVVIKKGFDEISDSQKVAAQTAAVLKSTGGIANVTAKHVDELAQSLSRMSGVDDELIGTGENLLLTFKNVRNEVGAGNAVFDRATAAALDLSRAGFGSVEGASIKLGKALNDPIKGMTALGRAGVTFSESQKAAIKALVETGDTLGAQKLILREVESQVGGSAKAYGDTLPGQLAKARNSFDEISAQVAVKFLPVLTKTLEWVNTHWSEISAVFGAVAAAVTTAVQGIAAVVTWLVGQWNRHQETITAIWKTVQAAVQGFSNWFRLSFLLAIQNVIAVVTAIWDRFGADLTRIVTIAFNQIRTVVSTVLGNLASVINALLAVLRGDWSEAWSEIGEIPGRTLRAAATTIRGLAGLFLTAARAIGAAVIDGITASLEGLAGKLRALLVAGIAAIGGLVSVAFAAAAEIGRALTQGVISGIGDIGGAIFDAAAGGITSAIDRLKGLAHIGSPSGLTRDEIGAPLGQGIVQGAIEALAALGPAMGAKIKDAVSGSAGTDAGGVLSAVTEARAGLAAAQAGGDPTAVIAAQKALDDTLYKQKEAGLEQRALLERTKVEEQTAMQRLRFEDWVALRTAQQAQEVAKEGAGQRAILKKIESYNPFFRLRGQELGESLAIGLLDMRGKVEEAALELANAVAKALGVSYNYAKSVVGDIEAKKNQGIAGLAAGGIVTKPTFAMIGEAGPEAVIPLGRGLGATIHIDLTVNGSVLTERDLVETVRRGLYDVARRNPGALPGVA